MSSPHRTSATGPADPDDAWRRYTTRELWSTWSPQIRSVRPGGRIRPGDRGVVLGLLVAVVPFTILARDDAARRWSWRVGVRPLAVRMDHGIDVVDGGCTAWMDLHGPAALGAAYAPFARRALEHLATGT